ncbi:MAG: glycosyltransferase [Acidobacteriota bacterium]
MFLALAAIAAAYQVLAILACAFRGRVKAPAKSPGPVSVLKPVRGMDPGLREAIRSHTILRGDYEFLCGVSQPNDPALPLLREFFRVHVVDSDTHAANAKVGVLIDLMAAARYSILVVNDADIRVEPDYLVRVTAPLADPRVGLVTCLYRPVGDTFAARFEALGVATDFAPSALVARLLGVDEFAMGSTLAFRREELERIGGFAAVADFLADDYQVGHRIHALGLKCVLSDVVVETHLGGGWRQVWEHQVRWARTIRVSRFGGYLGLPVTNATLWAAVAVAGGRLDLAAALLSLRLVMAFVSGWAVLRSSDVLYLWWLVPARDLFGFAVWLAGLFGNSVVWRGQRLRLGRDGKIQPA